MAVEELLSKRLEEDGVENGLEVVASPEPLHYRHSVLVAPWYPLPFFWFMGSLIK